MTPELVVDRVVLEANVATMARRIGAVDAGLRPHVKTHKCLEIAHLQAEAGARGITVATVGEAEVFAAAGFDDLFLAFPVWVDEAVAERLGRLAATTRLRVGTDSVAAGRRLRAVGCEVLVEIDSGHHRTGVPAQDAGELASALEDAGVRVAGVFSFPGHSYGADRRAVAAAEQDALLVARDRVRAALGRSDLIVSGGSSPSVEFAQGAGITEYRPGAYVFNDAQQWELGACGPEDIALTAHARVVSHAGGRLVLDSGSKILGADRAPWATGHGRLLDHPQARIVQLSEHHAVAELPGTLPALGSIVRVVPNHCCNAVNLVDELVVEAAGRRDRWAVAARGRNG